MRVIAFLLPFLLSVLSVRAYDVPSYAKEGLTDRLLTPIEGVWLWNSGALVKITADSQGRLTLTLVESPDPAIDTPQIIGTGTFAGTAGTYRLELKTEADALNRNKGGKKKMAFTARLANNGQLALTPIKNGWKLDMRRLLPYLFRISVRQEHAPGGIDGAIRVWPVTLNPMNPVIL